MNNTLSSAIFGLPNCLSAACLVVQSFDGTSKSKVVCWVAILACVETERVDVVLQVRKQKGLRKETNLRKIVGKKAEERSEEGTRCGGFCQSLGLKGSRRRE
uniref:Uncharacterized protein n=1 Tax=Rhodnius prolixus TaxID=13249 RepID=T1IDB7_RHOPR